MLDSKCDVESELFTGLDQLSFYLRGINSVRGPMLTELKTCLIGDTTDALESPFR